MAGYVNFCLLVFILSVTGLGILEASANIPQLDQDVEKDFKLETNTGLDANINEIFDNVMPMIKDLIIKNGLDPLRMNDVQKELHGILGMSGVLNLKKGWMQGLSAVKRSGDVVASYENKILTLDALLGLDVIDVAYDYGFKYWIVSRSGSLNARMYDTQLRLVLKVEFEHYRIILESFQVTSVRKMEVKLQGGTVDKILNAAINAFIGSFKTQVIQTVENEGSKLIAVYLQKINEKIPRPDGTLLMDLQDRAMVSNSNVWDNSEMVESIPTSIEFVVA